MQVEDIEIKRGYEVLSDNKVRFGIRVINNGDSAISDVEVILDYSQSLFELESSKIEELGNIPPSIPRTAKFILKPLSCVHKEEIGATVRYRDHKWEKHTVDMRPKEVHCVCPFLKEKTITRKDFLTLFNEGYPAERGLNFENIQPEKVIKFITHTCKNRLYKVDEFSIENKKILYLAGDSLGEKAYYLLTAVIIEREGIVQVLFQAKSDKEFGINGFLNEIVENLRHLVQSSSAAMEIGVIKREQVINIIDSVVQNTKFSDGEGSSLVKIEDEVAQRTNFGPSQEESKRKEAEEKLRRQQEEKERLKKAEAEKLRREKEKEEELEIKMREEKERKRREEEKKTRREWEEEQQKLREHREEAKRKGWEELKRKNLEAARIFHDVKQTTSPFPKKSDLSSGKSILRGIIIVMTLGILLIITTAFLSPHSPSPEDFDPAPTIDPENANPEIVTSDSPSPEAIEFFNKGNTLYDMGKYEEAVQAYDKAIEIDPEYAEAWVCKGYALNNIGKYQEADDILLTPTEEQKKNEKTGLLPTQLTNVERRSFQQVEYRSDAWKNQKYSIIKMFGKEYVPLKSYSKNKLAPLILDLPSEIEYYNVRPGELLDLDEGYYLEVKQVDDGEKAWLEFTKDGELVDDDIISIDDGNGGIWEVERDGIQGENDVVVFRVHVNQIFQGAVDSIVQIDGLWLIDYENAFTVKTGNELNGYEIMEINDEYISYRSSD